jgi:hypothetical protein
MTKEKNEKGIICPAFLISLSASMLYYAAKMQWFRG